MLTFVTVLKQEGKTATGIEVPPEVVAALGTSRKPAVKVTLNGYAYRSTVAVMSRKFMLPVSAEHRQGAGVKACDPVTVGLDMDAEPREVSVPADLQTALEENPVAQERFGQLSYSRQRQHVLAVLGTNNPDTRTRRTAKVIQTLTES